MYLEYIATNPALQGDSHMFQYYTIDSNFLNVKHCGLLWYLEILLSLRKYSISSNWIEFTK